MDPRKRQLDKDGFPVPATFDDLRREFSPTGEPAPEPTGGASTRFIRWALVLSLVALVAGTLVTTKGRHFVAAYFAQRAQEKYQADDLPGALADSERAIAWVDDDPRFYFQRAVYRLDNNEVEESLVDFNKVLVMNPSFASGYARRSVAYQRLGRHRNAIDDLSRAIQLQPSFEHNLLNSRAYARAIGNMELPEALADVEQAIEMHGTPNAAYIDTRGYIFYLMDRHEESLADLDQAVELMVKERSEFEGLIRKHGVKHARVAHDLRTLKESEGVLRYHRGLVHEKLGHEELAEEDKHQGVELGYNPALGVF